MAEVPEWAQELIVKVCKDHKRWPPTTEWKERGKREEHRWKYMPDGTRITILAPSSSSGTTWSSNRIRIRAGSDLQDQKLVLLHELAHHILNKGKAGRRAHHSLRFWRLAFKLYQTYGMDMDYAYQREKEYKKGATVAYNELGKE